MIPIFNHNDDRYVNSMELHKALEFSSAHYSRNFKIWVDSDYLFQGKLSLTKPVENYDYILSPVIDGDRGRGKYAVNYLIRLEFAKLITINSNSKLKNQFVQWLLSLEKAVENNQLMSRELILGLLEMAKLCTYIDMQLEFYNKHKAHFLSLIDDDNYGQFDKWRNNILRIDYSKAVGMEYHISSHIGNLKTKVERIAFLDSLQSIRNALFDMLKMIFNRVDPLYPKGTEKALDLANFTKKIFEVAGLKPDIKPKHYKPGDQLDMFREIESIDHQLINNAIKSLLQQ